MHERGGAWEIWKSRCRSQMGKAKGIDCDMEEQPALIPMWTQIFHHEQLTQNPQYIYNN